MDPSKDLFSPNPATPQDKVRTAYNRAFVNWQSYWVEAYRDQSFYLNNQWSNEERRYLQQEQRPDYVYNLVRACVNMVQGYQRKHRLSIIVEPVENSSNATATQFTKCMYHAMRHGRGHYAISDAFKGALVTGLGFVGLEMDYRFDPLNGDINYKFYPWNSIILDPFTTDLRGLTDCDYLIRRAYMSKEEAISKWPDKEGMIRQMQGNLRDELFTFLPQQRIYQSQNLLAYTEYWEQQYEEVKVVINPLTLQEIEVTKENAKMLTMLMKLPGVKSYKKQKPKMQFYALLNNEVVHEDTNPYNLTTYPFVGCVGVYEAEYDLYQYKLQSLIRCIRDPQVEFNKRISKMTDALDSQINNGWIIKKSRFDNPMDFYKTGQGRVIYAKNEADVNADARQIAASPLPAGLLEMQQIFNDLIMRICGVNETAIGQGDGTDVGVIEMMRTGAALVNLQDLFDGLRQSQEIIGNKSITLIQNNWTPEKVFMVTKEQPTKEFYLKQFGKYDAVCAEAPLTETQQQLFFRQLIQFKQMDAPISWSAILNAYPGQGKEKIVADMQAQEQQQQQMQQMQSQAEMQDKAIINDLLIKEGQIKMASAAEKLAKAEEDRAQAGHERALALKELEALDMDNINKFIDTILKLETAEAGSLQAQPINSGA
ncbi:MAG TPA: hypothetical protein VKZ95_08755 [Sphingobacteriaceae bacterium]|nr:hypothetical protein [Sphingobacteriaceae bacterium]